MQDLPDTEEAEAIDAVLRGGLRWLRFPPDLESRFRADKSARNGRLWVVCVLAAMVGFCLMVGLLVAPLVPDEIQLAVGLILTGIVILAIVFSYNALHAVRLTWLLARRQTLSAQRENALAALLERANAELRALSLTDSLTGVASRRRFDEALTALWQRPIEQIGIISLVLMDIDFFKRYNDFYGQVKGDEALRAVAEIVGGEFRGKHDLVARYGGQEFGVVLADCDLLDAQTVARRLCAAVEEFAIPHAARPDSLSCLTVSVGVGSFDPGSGGDPADLIKAADMALYRAKAFGRNCVMVQSSAAMSD